MPFAILSPSADNTLWHIEKTMENICEWSKADVAGYDIGSITEKQIDEFLRDMTWKL